MLDNDGYNERMNPYHVECTKHGSFDGPTDDCPKCIEEDDVQARERIPSSICWNCRHCEDEPSTMAQCGYYGFPQRPRKKRCKHFDAFTDDPGEQYVPEYEDDDGMEAWGEP